MSIALIIGAGARVGQATADTFARAGYKVAVASRSNKTLDSHKHFPFDASNPETVAGLFADVRKALGIPSVVVYNAYGAHFDKPGNPFSVSLAEITTDMNINAISVYAAAAESVKGFEELQSNGKLGQEGATFIMTGNVLNDSSAPGFLTFSMQKGAAALLIKHLALVAYKNKAFKFYWGDQRNADGSPMLVGLSGPAHGEEYLKLAQDPNQGPWQYTFVEGAGYQAFKKEDVWIPGA